MACIRSSRSFLTRLAAAGYLPETLCYVGFGKHEPVSWGAMNNTSAAAYRMQASWTSAAEQSSHVAAHNPLELFRQLNDTQGCFDQKWLVAQPQELSAINLLMQVAAGEIEQLHSFTSLPWWISLPLATYILKFALLPLSLKQAKVVRTNFTIYKEATALAQKQYGLGDSAGHDSYEAHGAFARLSHASMERLNRSAATLKIYHELRTKLDCPHPAWIILNPMIQAPFYLIMAWTVRAMAYKPWPGFTEEGPLWCPDLTLRALELTTWDLPLGWGGLVLPLTCTAVQLTSVRLGTQAAHILAKQGDRFGWFMGHVLPRMLVTMVLAKGAVMLVMPHAVLLHWFATSSFTLGLQLVLRMPAARSLLIGDLPAASQAPGKLQVEGVPDLQHHHTAAQHLQQHLTAATAATTSQQQQQPASQSDSGTDTGPAAVAAAGSGSSSGGGGSDELLDDEGRPLSRSDLLVVAAAQLSAAQREVEAVAVLQQALALDPAHVRAHYSLGQIYVMRGDHAAAEPSFRAAAQHAQDPGEAGQAWYCLGTTLHNQGRLEEARQAYQHSCTTWARQPVLWWALALTCQGLGDVAGALQALDRGLEAEQQQPLPPLRDAMIKLRRTLSCSTSGGGSQ